MDHHGARNAQNAQDAHGGGPTNRPTPRRRPGLVGDRAYWHIPIQIDSVRDVVWWALADCWRRLAIRRPISELLYSYGPMAKPFAFGSGGVPGRVP
jgi:hypothetical protein